MLVTIVLVALAAGTYGAPEGETDFSQSCHNMTWACHDLETCTKCQKLSSCIEVWKQIRAPTDNSDICGICSSVLIEARWQLLINETHDFEEILDQTCKLQPTTNKRNECQKLVDEIGPELSSMLTSQIDCNTLCTLAKSCNQGSILQLIQQQYVVSAPLLMPVAADTNEASETLMHKILDLVSKAQDADNCELCETLLDYIKGILDSASTKDKVKDELKKLCQHLGDLSIQCENLVDEHFDQLFDILINNFNSAAICKALHLCSPELSTFKLVPGREVDFNPRTINSPRSAVSVTAVTLVPTLRVHKTVLAARIQPSVQNNIEREQLAESSSIKENGSESNPNGFITCLICKKVIAFLGKELGRNRTEAAIRNALEKVCYILPKRWRGKCTGFVDKHADKIVDLLKHEATPSVACAALFLCFLEPSVEETRMTNSESESNLNNPLTCEICKQVIEYLEKELDVNRTEEAIRVALEKVCNILPQSWRSKCTDFIDEYTDTIVELLQREVSPSAVCTALHVCVSQPKALKQSLQKDSVEHNSVEHSGSEPNLNNPVTCELCKMVIDYLEKELGKNQTEEAIRNALGKVCNIIPRRWRNKCIDFVDKYTDTIVDLLQREVSASIVCTTLHMCSSQPNTEEARETSREEKYPGSESNLNDTLTCEICKQLIDYLEKELGENRTEEAIRDALKKVCNILPQSWRSKCTDFIDEYTDMIVELLQREVSPAMVCAALHVCVSQPKAHKQNFQRVSVEHNSNKHTGNHRRTDQQPNHHIRHISVSSEKVGCKVCRTLVAFVEHELKGGNSTEDEIRRLLDYVCRIFPKDMQTQCQNFVNRNFDTLVSQILHEVKPDDICLLLNACPAVSGISKSSDFIRCEICKQVMDYLIKELGENRTEEAIRKALDKVCDVLPKHWRGKCTHFVDKYADKIVELLKSKVAPTAICKALGVCSSTPESRNRHWNFDKTRS